MTQAFNLSQLANKVNSSGQLDATTGLTNTSSLGFPSGTRMSFQQTTAPTGWTKDTAVAINDSILRLVTGTVSSGGSTVFSTWNAANPSTGATTLATTQIPSHTHGITGNAVAGDTFGSQRGVGTGTTTVSSSTGGGNSHTHGGIGAPSIKYYDFIVASKT